MGLHNLYAWMGLPWKLINKKIETRVLYKEEDTYEQAGERLSSSVVLLKHTPPFSQNVFSTPLQLDGKAINKK